MKHKKAIFLLAIPVVIILAIAVLWWPLRFDRYGFSAIDWVDLVKYNNASYTSVFPRTEVDPKQIEKNIGDVQFMLSGNVGNPNYQLRNLDAAYLPQHTRLFSIKNDPDSIAALVDGVYYKYEKERE